jgi:valyl-tRNA synthetase
VLGEVRKKKSEEKKPLRTPVMSATIRAPKHNLDLLRLVWRDVSASGVFQEEPAMEESQSFESEYELGQPEART